MGTGGDIFSGTVGLETVEKAYRRAADQEAAQGGELIQEMFSGGVDASHQVSYPRTPAAPLPRAKRKLTVVSLRRYLCVDT
jgi:hypothetical protein